MSSDHQSADATESVDELIDVLTKALAESGFDPGAELSDEIEALREEAARNLAGWQRAQADYENLKRRQAQEVRDRAQQSQQAILLDLLDLADDFERANREAPLEDDTDDPWKLGVVMISQKLTALLSKQQVRRIDTADQSFDPNFHESAGQLPGQHDEIVAVLRTGYMHGTRVLRATRVVVGDGSIDPSESEAAPAADTEDLPFE